MTTPHVPDGSIIITPSEVYAEVKALTEVVRQLVARDEAEKADRDRLALEVADLAKRLNWVEQKIWIASGFCAAAGSGIGAVVVSLINR